MVVNAGLNPPRPDFDRLKAMLVNGVRQGPASQSRDGHADVRAHLLGCLAYFKSLNPSRANKLQTVFERIMW